MKARQTAINVLFALAAVLVATVLLELVSRVLFPHWGARGIAAAGVVGHDPLLGWAQQPGSSGIFEQPDFRVRITINGHGLRDRDYSVARVPGVGRVLLLGDSMAWGFGVEHGETLDERVETRRGGIEIVNAAVPGYGTDQELLYLEHRGLRFAPDAVVVLFHPNDFGNNQHLEQYGYRKPVFRPRGDALVLEGRPVPAPGLAARVASFVRYRTFFPRQLLLGLERLRPSPAADRPPADDGGVELAARLLAEMARLAAEHDATLSVLLIPAEQPALRRRLAELGARLAELGVRHRDLAPDFARADRPTTFPHNSHWNAHGHALAALALEHELVDLGLLPP